MPVATEIVSWDWGFDKERDGSRDGPIRSEYWDSARKQYRSGIDCIATANKSSRTFAGLTQTLGELPKPLKVVERPVIGTDPGPPAAIDYTVTWVTPEGFAEETRSMPPEARSGFHPQTTAGGHLYGTWHGTRGYGAGGHQYPDHHPPHLVSGYARRERLLTGGDINYEAWRNQSLSGASLAYLR